MLIDLREAIIAFREILIVTLYTIVISAVFISIVSLLFVTS